MPDIKKFLDQEGLSLLWRKIEAELKTRDSGISDLSDLIGVVETAFNEYKTSNDTNITNVSSRVENIETEINNAEAFEPISDSDIDTLFA